MNFQFFYYHVSILFYKIFLSLKNLFLHYNLPSEKSSNFTELEGDYGLFVTLSDYTKNAKKFLDNQPIIKALNGSELVDLILKYYDDMPEDFKDVVKLKKVFIPVIDEE